MSEAKDAIIAQRGLRGGADAKKKVVDRGPSDSRAVWTACEDLFL